MPSMELSPFQKEKLQYYFNFLEPNEEGVLESHSIDRLMERILKFSGWTPNNPLTNQCREIYTAFFEILFEKAEEKGGQTGAATLDNWYEIWSHILPGCKGMSNFPVWLRLMPKVLFSVIDRNEDDEIDRDELTAFYKNLARVQAPDGDLDKWSKKAFNSMTDNGRYPLNLDLYEMIFANLLIGRTPHGPGKYLFGCFVHEEAPFQLIQPPPEEDENDDGDRGNVASSSANTGANDENEDEKRPRKFGVNFT